MNIIQHIVPAMADIISAAPTFVKSQTTSRRTTVQQLVENDENNVPDSYVLKQNSSIYGPIDLTVPFATDVPFIDLSQLISTSPARDAELLKLRSALTSWGCFQLVNHGMETSFLDQIRQVSVQFFHLTMEEKLKYARPADSIHGYGSDMLLVKDRPLDWVDRLYLIVAPKHQQVNRYWPQNPESFRETMHKYTGHILEIQKQLLRSIARSISLPEDCFLNQFGEDPVIYARFNFYPRCSRPNQVNGLKPHSDRSGLTFLIQSQDVQGLQLFKDNQWFQLPIVPEAILVNLGDVIEIMSNGVFKSSVHKAVTNSAKERMSLAMFCVPCDEKEIGPLEELIDENRPRVFRKIKNYTDLYFRSYQLGERALDAVKSLDEY